MKTTHQYIDNNPILADSKRLIVGTIHPHFHENFHLPFFYGNKLSIWKILSKVFPGELGNLDSVDCIKGFLLSKRISITDVVRECTRITDSALDKDLIPTRLNYEMVEAIKKSTISEILFTSGFGKNNAFKLFYVDILGQRLNKKIKENREMTLSPDLLGREIKLTVLYSPSGTANTGLVNSKEYLKNKERYAGLKSPVQQFKIDYYKSKFDGGND